MNIMQNGILAPMQKFMLLVIIAARAAAAFSASETNAVDVIALGRLGTGTSPNGWYAYELDNYAESSASALRFNTKDDYLDSPVFTRPVTRIVLQVRSSSAAHRRLAFTPLRSNGSAATNLTRLCAYSPTDSSFPEQTLTWPWSAHVTKFRVRLEGDSTTAWGIKTMSLVFDDPAPGTAVVIR